MSTRTSGGRERRLKEALAIVCRLYDEPGLLLVNYTVAGVLRGILGRKLARETIDRPGRITMEDIYRKAKS